MLNPNRTARRGYQLGFTIVELLIVIVVIGILAAIIMVGYTGIIDRANDARLQSAVRQYANILQAYKSQYGYYPNTAHLESDSVCLGHNYPADQDFEEGHCMGGHILQSTILRQELGKISDQFPDASYETLTLWGEVRSRGAVYHTDGIGPRLEYAIKLSKECPVGERGSEYATAAICSYVLP